MMDVEPHDTIVLESLAGEELACQVAARDLERGLHCCWGVVELMTYQMARRSVSGHVLQVLFSSTLS